MTTTAVPTTSSTSPTSGPVSIASNSSAGAAGGSVIDVSSLVSELVAAQEGPQQTLIANETSANTASITALGTLQSALSTFQSSLSSLASASQFNAETANSSNQNVFTATAGGDAVSGNYAITVGNLASAQQLLSGPFSGGANAGIGTGTLQISLGSSSFSVTVNSSNDTLAGLAAAINAAPDNPGVTASVVTGTDGGHLVLTSTLTGQSNTISVTETDGGSALSALTYGTGNTGNYTQEAQAANASFSIAGVPYTSASNTVSNALTGVTLNLAGTTATGSSATLSVSNDTSTVEQNIQSFVTAYNTLEGALSQLGSYDQTTNTAGPMLGNPVLTGIQNEIQQTLNSVVGTSTYNSLASIGITTQQDGTLAVDNSTLQTALSSNFNAVSQLFSSTNGVAAQLNSQITDALQTGSSINTYSQTLVTQQNALTQQSNNLTTQMNALTASLTQQYSSLNALLSSLQTTSSQLSQAFADLPTVQGVPNA